MNISKHQPAKYTQPRKRNGKSSEADSEHHIIKNVPDCLAVILTPLLDDCIVMSISETVTAPLLVDNF